MASFNALKLFLIFCSTVFPSVYGYGRIAGGEDTTIERRPYQASLQYLFPGMVSLSCGASIISKNYLLSAAHCHPGNNLPYYYARVGSTIYNFGGQVLKIAEIRQHPQYNADTLDYDVAVYSFPSGVEIVLGPTAAIIPLTDVNDPVDESLVTISGWGVTSESEGSVSTFLQEADIPVLNHDKCRDTYPFLTDRQTCLGGTSEDMLSACFGDTGGPGVQDGVQYLVVSGGYRCDFPDTPGIYARVSSVRQWINEQTGV